MNKKFAFIGSLLLLVAACTVWHVWERNGNAYSFTSTQNSASVDDFVPVAQISGIENSNNQLTIADVATIHYNDFEVKL